MSATYHDSIPYTLFQLKKCLSMDLEISPDTGVLQAMAAYRPDTGYEPHLKATFPNCKVLEMPVVDTLHLNPLAFPQHPYHHLNQSQGEMRRRIG